MSSHMRKWEISYDEEVVRIDANNPVYGDTYLQFVSVDNSIERIRFSVPHGSVHYFKEIVDEQ